MTDIDQAGSLGRAAGACDPQRGSVDLHALHDRLMHVSRLATMGEMAGGIAHEINQPLAAITNYARACEHFLATAQPDLDEVRSAMREIGAEALRAAEIIRRLRRLFGRQDSVRAPTDLNELIEELQVLSLADARAHDVRIRFELGAGLPRLALDRVQIQHALLNLLRNALEALEDLAPDAREVSIRTRCRPDGEVEVDVCDNGFGAAPEILASMFDPFRTTKATGSGLGLSVSRSIVRAHGGSIEYRPNVPRGACFRVRMPAIQG